MERALGDARAGLGVTKPPFSHYHAHVYFDASSVEFASALCRAAGERFGVEVGRVHRKKVGPHPRWSCQLAFSHRQSDRLLAWLDEHRGELTVFVHALSGDEYADHTEYVSWLGDPVALNLWVFGPARVTRRLAIAFTTFVSRKTIADD